MWASLLPATAFAFGADIVADYEYAEQGVQSWNTGEGQYSFNTSIGFLFFDTLLYLFLGWYVEQVMPREYGVAKPFWFLFSPKYWCACFWPYSSAPDDGSMGSSTQFGDGSRDVDDHSHGSPNRSLHDTEDQDGNESIADPHLIPRIVTKSLVKRYNKAADAAVNHLNLTLYESQITTLLGHNGE